MRAAHSLNPFLQAGQGPRPALSALATLASLSLLAALGALGTSPAARAQGSPQPPPAQSGPMPDFLDPHAPRLLLQHLDLHQSSALMDKVGDWRQANAAVARFPRGHGDIVKWEAARQASREDASGPGAPAHDMHGGRP